VPHEIVREHRMAIREHAREPRVHVAVAEPPERQFVLDLIGQRAAVALGLDRVRMYEPLERSAHLLVAKLPPRDVVAMYVLHHQRSDAHRHAIPVTDRPLSRNYADVLPWRRHPLERTGPFVPGKRLPGGSGKVGAREEAGHGQRRIMQRMGGFGFRNPLDDLPQLPHVPEVPNPFEPLMPHLPEMPQMPGIPGFNPTLPNPFEHYTDKAGQISNEIQHGATNTAPDPALATKGQDEKSKFQAQAFASMGIDEHTFATMDPIQRNGLINAAYAKMYKSDPETMKWAGMAAMASDKAGTGMMQTYGLSMADAIPGGDTARDAVGAPDGDQVRALLAKGNAGIFNDMMWQHMAFQSGGIAEMQKAFKEGSITKEQLAGWQQLAAGKDELSAAKASGDQNAIKKANDDIWGGNAGLLKEEQNFVGKQVYRDSPEAASAFKWLSGSPLNVMGVTSPIPGGTTFGEHRKGMGGGDDVGDFDQRWDWIQKDMLPEYQKFESDPAKMNKEMDKYIGRENKNQWDEKHFIEDAYHDPKVYERTVDAGLYGAHSVLPKLGLPGMAADAGVTAIDKTTNAAGNAAGWAFGKDASFSTESVGGSLLRGMVGDQSAGEGARQVVGNVLGHGTAANAVAATADVATNIAAAPVNLGMTVGKGIYNEGAAVVDSIANGKGVVGGALNTAGHAVADTVSSGYHAVTNTVGSAVDKVMSW
jgi:hypothetical protein